MVAGLDYCWFGLLLVSGLIIAGLDYCDVAHL